MMCPINGLAVGEVADFETLNFHLKTKFDMENNTSINHENGNDANRLLYAVSPPPYDCNGIAICVKIQPQNIIAWYAWDWNKWCKNGSRDIIEGDVVSWAYCT